MTNEEKRAVARAIAKQNGKDYQDRKSIYIRTLSDFGLHTNCCEEGICGGSPWDTRLHRGEYRK